MPRTFVFNYLIPTALGFIGGALAVHYFAQKPKKRITVDILSAASKQKWKGRSILSVKDISREDLDELFEVADQMDEIVQKQGTCDLCSDSVLTAIFYEPSTRTRCSFEAAFQRLGGKVVSIADARSQSSVKKGETIEDTIRCLQTYSDVIAMRHPQKGSAKQAASVADVPILNGGDGPGEHPTQALLDCYTIYRHCGEVDGKTITLVGDLKYGRTVHSLAVLLTRFKDVTINCVSPPSLAMPDEFLEFVGKFPGITIKEYTTLDTVLPSSDVVYMTRIQKERFPSVEDYEKVNGYFILCKKTIDDHGKKGMKIMHPLPRVNEIATDVDDLEEAVYFDEMRCGMLIRMALFCCVLGKC